MKLQKLIKIILPVFAVVFLFGRIEFVFSYDDQVAHPQIAELAAELYNQNFEPDLTTEEIGWIKQGAREEDSPTRYLNHFYDPVYGNGFSDLAGMNSIKVSFASAKDWAVQPLKQVDFALGDRSWPRGLHDFSQDNRRMAFIELGHIVHLISDMSVPAHTRNSEHVGDPLERFIKENWSSIAGQLKYAFTPVSNLNDAFVILAKYSNSNFYSEKTIESDKYKILKIVEQNKILIGNRGCLLAISQDGVNNKINLYYTFDNADWREGQNKKFLNVPSVHISYATHLIPKAIGYSAGAIKLFVDEGNKKIAEDENKTFFQTVMESKLPLSRISKEGIINRIFGFAVSGAERALNYFSAMPKVEPSLAQEEPESTETSLTKFELMSAPVLSAVPTKPIKLAVVETPVVVEQPIEQVLPVLIPEPAPIIISPPPKQPEPPVVYSCNGCGGVKDIVEPVVAPIVETTAVVIETPTTTVEIATPPDTSGQATTPVIEIPTTTVEIVTTTPETETVTTTVEIPPEESIIMSPPQLDIGFATTTYTTSSVVTIFGECATGTASIQVYRLDALMSPSSTPELMTWVTPTMNLPAWQVEIQINPGESVFYFVAVGATTSSVFSERAQIIKTEEPKPEVIKEPAPDYIFTTFDESTSTSTIVSAIGQSPLIWQVIKAPVNGTVSSVSFKIKKYPTSNLNHPEFSESAWGGHLYKSYSNTGEGCISPFNMIADAVSAIGTPGELTEIVFTFPLSTIQKDSYYCFSIERIIGVRTAQIFVLTKSPADTYFDGKAGIVGGWGGGSLVDGDFWMKIPIIPIFPKF